MDISCLLTPDLFPDDCTYSPLSTVKDSYHSSKRSKPLRFVTDVPIGTNYLDGRAPRLGKKMHSMTHCSSAVFEDVSYGNQRTKYYHGTISQSLKVKESIPYVDHRPKTVHHDQRPRLWKQEMLRERPGTHNCSLRKDRDLFGDSINRKTREELATAIIGADQCNPDFLRENPHLSTMVTSLKDGSYMRDDWSESSCDSRSTTEEIEIGFSIPQQSVDNAHVLNSEGVWRTSKAEIQRSYRASSLGEHKAKQLEKLRQEKRVHAKLLEVSKREQEAISLKLKHQREMRWEEQRSVHEALHLVEKQTREKQVKEIRERKELIAKLKKEKEEKATSTNKLRAMKVRETKQLMRKNRKTMQHHKRLAAQQRLETPSSLLSFHAKESEASLFPASRMREKSILGGGFNQEVVTTSFYVQEASANLQSVFTASSFV